MKIAILGTQAGTHFLSKKILEDTEIQLIIIDELAKQNDEKFVDCDPNLENTIQLSYNGYNHYEYYYY